MTILFKRLNFSQLLFGALNLIGRGHSCLTLLLRVPCIGWRLLVVRGQLWSHLVVVGRLVKIRLIEHGILMGSMEFGLSDPGGTAPFAPLPGAYTLVVKNSSIHRTSLSSGLKRISMTRRCQRVSRALILPQGSALSHSVPFSVFLIHLRRVE